MNNDRGHVTKQQLVDLLREARARTLELVADLTDQEMIGPQLPIVNPMRWEIGHVAWFQEKWTLRHLRGFPAQMAQCPFLLKPCDMPDLPAHRINNRQLRSDHLLIGEIGNQFQCARARFTEQIDKLLFRNMTSIVIHSELL